MSTKYNSFNECCGNNALPCVVVAHEFVLCLHAGLVNVAHNIMLSVHVVDIMHTITSQTTIISYSNYK